MAEARNNRAINRILVLSIVAKFISLTGFDHLLDWLSDSHVAEMGGFNIHESNDSRFDEALRTLDVLQAEYYYDCKLSMRGNPKAFCRSTIKEVSRN
jgi:hypothetical protein